ncbi:MAG TPA: SDR family NAD(P)-dependent oxidoreductase [Povalibacter sp.]|uniref:SDR family oxidoreductase n=1 Tax=Povalibacter sp. TaxID=1962978 RepID=UPI002C65EDC5|nr:SDR family NAD(P)-dependent oxidoreductase [Povalibacter sp.]HMN46516.1 SDR family NAD(P)-dependent oxidoreductase [Povalibacter sp.]
MQLAGKVIAITGGGKGIGRALARRFAREGARHIAVADIDLPNAQAVAAEIGGSAHRVDVGNEADIAAFIEAVERTHGPIDLFCSNAGIGVGQGLDAPDAAWQKMLDVNLMAHVYAARHLVPRMIQRGGGYLLNTASAAGLLSQIGSVTYTVTKHAAVGLAEWIALTHAHQGIKVSVLCPQAVRTDMIAGNEGDVASVNGIMEPEEVAEAVVAGLAAGKFLILPHAEVTEYMQRKVADRDRWIAGMNRLHQRYHP